MNKLLLVLCIISLSSCAGSPTRLWMMSSEGLNQEKSTALCDAYFHTGADKIKDELVSRDEITEDEWKLIESEDFKVGMSELSLICSLGKPDGKGMVTGSTSEWGEKKQYTYQNYSFSKRFYVYVENGTVTAYQKNWPDLD